jgi:hypothetical protein
MLHGLTYEPLTCKRYSAIITIIFGMRLCQLTPVFFGTRLFICLLLQAPRPRSSGVRYAVLEQHQHPPAEDSRALRQKPKPQKGRKRAAQKRIYDLGPIQQTEAEAIASAIAQAPAYEFDEFDVYRGLVLDISYKWVYCTPSFT